MRTLTRVIPVLLLLFPTEAFAQYQPEVHGPGVAFDRLDGKGRTGVRVDVIEWGGNLELHFYPAGSLAGLALALDKKDESKPVMIIGYRFDEKPGTQLIRRAILGIPLKSGFRTYQDQSTEEYDKIIISNNSLSGELKNYPLDNRLIAKYPAGAEEERNELARRKAIQEKQRNEKGFPSGRLPAQQDSPKTDLDDSGAIRPFGF